MKYGLLYLLLIPAIALSQNGTTLSGFVRDKQTGESLPFANILMKGTTLGASTNIDGYYAVPKVAPGRYQLKVTLVGYRDQLVDIEMKAGVNLVKNIMLVSTAIEVQEVVVSAEKDAEKKSTQTGRIVMNAQELQSIPSVGESDVFRALQIMPGVKSVSEISSGLFVRGGSADQNLILLDGTVVYNPSHLFGFFSTFNSDAVKDIDLMKGGYPAEYGGRLSSVLNVTNKDGDRNTTKGKASISLISSRVTGEGPVGNGSWFLSARRTYFDQLVSAAKLDTGKDALPLYYFYDANGKINQDFGHDDKISVIAYLGKDNMDFKLGDGEINLNMDWGNTTGAFKWIHIFNPKFFSNFTVSYSAYDAGMHANFGGLKVNQENGVRDLSVKGDMDFYPANDHLVKLGFWWSQYRLTFNQNFGDNQTYKYKETPALFSLYAQDDWSVNERMNVQAGVRLEYQDLTKKVTAGPRISARYALDENTSLKAAAGVYYQYLNAVPVGDVNGFSPFDVWVPVNEKMNPGRSVDLILGVEAHPFDEYQLTVETYYKEYKDILNWIGEPTTEQAVEKLFYNGKGSAYGVETFLQKRLGDFTGSIGYTLAWTKRTFAELNHGKAFYPKFDRRHDLTATGSYRIGTDWTISSTFTYGTGQAYTMGTARYIVRTPDSEFTHVLPGEIYNQRLEPYHRLDIGVTKQASFFGLRGSWYVQIYNVYNHRNIWFKEFDTKKNPTEITDVRLLPILPTFGIDLSF
ncbi:MAG TPA: TonB-dependent receptor [Bacteroidota bacterium]|nr:TonB-dependent receptor [Bacteroidota bacterium]